jgi:TorA maturation chaperone TorD
MQNNEYAVDELMKGECYRFLAACFYQPKKEILVTEQLLPTLVSNLLQVCPAAAPFAQRMQESLASYTEEELTVEYARLFVGPFGLKAPPYGSIYLDNDHIVMGPSTVETIGLYEQEGLARDEGFHELPDHIAVELEFMYYLSYRQAEALQKGDMSRAESYRIKKEQFRTRFIGKWVPQFCTHIQEETDNGFYSALADCVSTLVKVQEVPARS